MFSTGNVFEKTAACAAALAVLGLTACTTPTNPHKRHDNDGGVKHPDATGMIDPSHVQPAPSPRGLDFSPRGELG